MTIKLDAFIDGRIKLVQCPYCNENIHWVSGETEVCVFCYKSIPSAISVANIPDMRIDIYNDNLNNTCFEIFSNCY